LPRSSLISRARARLRGLFHRDVVAGEIREELEFHVRMRAEDYERAGTPAPLAIAQARQRFGNLAHWQDSGYDVRGGGVMETIIQDLKYAARLLRRQPGFSLMAILTLALGIGMTTAIASVIDAAMLRPLPYPDPHELVQLLIEVPRSDRPGGVQRYGPSALDVQTIRALPNSPISVSMWRSIFGSRVADGPEPERVRGMEIDQEYLGLFGVVPIRGRAIQEHDTRPGAAPVAMIGYGYWQRRFGGRDDVVGERIKLDNESVEVIGVLPRSFYRNTPLFVPLKTRPESVARRGTGGAIYGRLKSEVTIERAERELTEILSRVENTSERVPGSIARLQTLLARETSTYWTTANILLGAVGLILLIACVNVGGLLLARGTTRLHELAIRASIGAGRIRIVRQLLTESLLLALIGGTLGIGVAWLTLDSLVANIPLPVTSNAPATLNWSVLGFSLALSLVTGILFGLAPAIRLSRARVSGALARGGQRSGAALSTRGGQWLIGIEIALALVLMTGAGLMIRSFGRLVSTDLGFEPESIMTVQAMPVDLQAPVYSQYYADLLDRIRQMPDVEATGAINHLPLMGSFAFTSVTVGETKKGVTLRQVLPGYFEAMGLQPHAGRFMEQSDLVGGRSVAVIGQRAARFIFGDDPAVGRTVMWDGAPTEVVGVVPDLKVEGAQAPPVMRDMNEVFVLYRPKPTQRPDPLVVVVRPRSDARGLSERLRQAAISVGPRTIVERVRSGSDWLDDTVVTPRRRTILLSLLGGLGLVLALVGVFGMTAYAVARRTREIGVRMAFGATAGNVVREMVRSAAWPIAAGLTVGFVGAWFATELISTFLFETATTDAPTFAGAVVTLALAALIAVWIPARRAARVDPVTSLRSE
jgi:putative ABC transport system permease protein